MKSFNLLMVLFLSLIFAFTVNCTASQNGNSVVNVLTETNGTAKATAPDLLVVKFHADWCGSCRALGPAITDLTNKLDGQAVLFTELDFTNNSKKHQSILLASALGLDEVVANNKGTGFILVIDSKTKEISAKLDKTQSVKEMSKIISGLL